MFRMFSLLFVALALASSQVAFGAPSCSHGSKDVDACVSKCRTKFGWPGFAMGKDRWGSVVQPSDEDISNKVVKACGGPKDRTSPDPAFGVGSSPPVATSTPPYVLPTPIVGSEPSKPPINSTSSTPHKSKTSSVSLPSPHDGGAGKPTPSPPGPPKESPTSSPSPSPTPKPTDPLPPPPPPSSSSTTSSTPKPSPSPSPSPKINVVASGDISAYLSAHNNVRAQHGANPLTWSDELAAKAQQWANGCVFKHSGGTLGKFGENLAAGTGSGYTIATAVKSWTDEVSDYNSNNPQPSHFTQVVWKETTQVGCAVQDCSGIFDPSFGLAHFHVCEYSPAGNVIGDFPKNVQA